VVNSVYAMTYSLPAPLWLPDSSGFLFWADYNLFCIANLSGSTQDCREVVFASLSHAVADPLVAYVTQSEMGFQLCIAPIVDQGFGKSTCPVTHTDPILFPLWRP
jgi:hypothetical protein